MKESYVKELTVARSAARKAGRAVMGLFRTKIGKTSKRYFGDFVTKADRLSEKIIISEIKKKFPEHAILAEESGKSGSHKCRWLIDPIDGTANYYHGIPSFAVIIALEKGNEVVLSVIYSPYTNEMYHATREGGAFLNGKRIQVSKRGKDFMYEYSGIYAHRERRLFKKLLERTLREFAPNFRIIACAGLDCAQIALGSVDGVIFLDRDCWDVAGGALLVEEAGGRVTDIKGKKWDGRTRDFIISNGKMHGKLLKIARELE